MNSIRFLLITYLLSVQLSLTFSITSFIKNYDTLNYEPNHRVFRRSAVTNVKKINIKFQAFQKNFHLNVFEDYSILHPETEIIVGGIAQQNVGVVPVHGHIENNRGSEVYGTIVDGIFRGTIKLDRNNETGGKYYVEHSAYHFTDNPGFHSIIYHDIDVSLPDSHPSSITEHSHCGWSQPIVAHQMKLISLYHSGRNHSSHNHKNPHSRVKRRANLKSTQQVCNLYLQSDTFLWNKVMSLHHVNGQHHLAIKEISSIFTQHVQGAQAIYQNTIFQTFGGRGHSYNGIGFRVDRVRINTTEDCEAPHKHTNPFCSPNIDVTNFLNLNSYMRHDDFCLAYVFTYRDFNGGTLGLAWVAEPGGSGGVCEKNRLMQEAGWSVQKSLNTGIVTLLNYGSYVALKVSQLTFAHEMGHNFGSKHDDDHRDHRECLPSIDDPRGNYIMFASATSGEKENNNKFSVCSKDSIARLLDRVTSSNNDCFSKQEGSFCGNKLTEEGEECDCGYSKKDCQDRCCNPKLSNAACKLTSTVKILGQVMKVRCSPNAGECCNKKCQFEPRTRLCRYEGECYKQSMCTGGQTKCPPSLKKADLTRCQDNTRVCKNGECVGSVCESVPGWQECSIIGGEGVTPDMMCFVACKRNITNSPCISTFDLQEKSQLRVDYQELVNVLMFNHKAIRLKSGAPCDNYHGYCDAFLRCRSVEADGPLARIKDMIFSSQMLGNVKRWTTQFWWAVMLICIASIVFVGIFLRVCSKSTPSTNPNGRQHKPMDSHINDRHHNHRHRRHHQHRHSSRRRPRSTSSRHRVEVVTNDDINPLPASQITDGPPLPPRSLPTSALHRPSTHRHRHRHRPLSMVQSRFNHIDPISRPFSLSLETNIEMGALSSHNVSGNPPPAYESPMVLPHQHGHGRGKKGHLHALNEQASRYH